MALGNKYTKDKHIVQLQSFLSLLSYQLKTVYFGKTICCNELKQTKKNLKWKNNNQKKKTLNLSRAI